MQPVFLFKKRTGAMGSHVAGTAGFCVAVPAFIHGQWVRWLIKTPVVRAHWLSALCQWSCTGFWFTSGWPRTGKNDCGCVAGRTVRRRSSSTTRGGDYGNRAAEKLRFIHYLHGWVMTNVDRVSFWGWLMKRFPLFLLFTLLTLSTVRPSWYYRRYYW